MVSSGPTEVLAGLRAVTGGMKEIGFVGSPNLLQFVNDLTRPIRDYVSFLVSQGENESAAEALSELSRLYFAAATASRFSRPAEEVRALASPGNYWALRALQLQERARLRSEVGLSFSQPQGIRKKATSSDTLPGSSQLRIIFSEEVKTAQHTGISGPFFVLTSLNNEDLVPAYRSAPDLPSQIQGVVSLRFSKEGSISISPQWSFLCGHQYQIEKTPLEVPCLPDPVWKTGASHIETTAACSVQK